MLLARVPNAFISDLILSCLERGWELTGRGPALLVNFASRRRALLLSGVKYPPVYHPVRADSHSAKPEASLQTITGLFSQGTKACHQGGVFPTLRTGATPPAFCSNPKHCFKSTCSSSHSLSLSLCIFMINFWSIALIFKVH